VSIDLSDLRDDAEILSVASSDILNARDHLREAAKYIEQLEAVAKLAAKLAEVDPQKAFHRPDSKDFKALRQALHEAGYL
jgi:hypothetical protein